MKVLIADDDKTSRLVIRKQLSAWGYELVECDNGHDALSHLLAPESPHLPSWTG